MTLNSLLYSYKFLKLETDCEDVLGLVLSKAILRKPNIDKKKRQLGCLDTLPLKIENLLLKTL